MTKRRGERLTGNTLDPHTDQCFRRIADIPAILQHRKSCSYKILDRRREKRVARIPGKSVVGGRRVPMTGMIEGKVSS